MPWAEDNLAQLPETDDVRLRGLDMTRLETFCDAAFAFAVTLLVISNGTIPTSFSELIEALKGVPAFEAIAGCTAFYPAKMDACLVDGERVQAQPGDFYGGWITSHVVGPFKGLPGSTFW